MAIRLAVELRLAAEQGNAAAQVALWSMYANGLGVPQDYAESARWYRLAADQGLAQAQQGLGLLYALGDGVPQDPVVAHMWLNLATAQSSGEQRETYEKSRDLVAEQMTRQQIAEAQRLAREWKPTVEP